MKVLFACGPIVTDPFTPMGVIQNPVIRMVVAPANGVGKETAFAHSGFVTITWTVR